MVRAKRFLALDIETAKIVPGGGFNWRAYRPLGITCIASVASGEKPRVWFSKMTSGGHAPQMSRQDVANFVKFVQDQVADGAVPVTWNGLAFDFDILAEESGMLDTCRQLARHHIDMMFHVICEKGFPVALKNAALGMKLPGKLAGVEGIDAPALWKAGEFDTVKQYVAQDVRTTLAIAEEGERRGGFSWLTSRGTVSSFPLSRGWLTVEEAMKLPLPDTSWMSQPLEREHFIGWLSKEQKQKVAVKK